MKIFLISISVVSALLMIVVILLQQGKGADLGAAFGRGAQGGLFTATGKANFLTRITSGLVTVFLLSSLALSVFLGDSQQDGVLQDLQGDSVPAVSGDEEEIEIIGNAADDEEEEIILPGDGGEDDKIQTPD